MWKWETETEAKGVIVIIHNMLEHTGRYAYVITHLRRNGYHVIMGDLPGQGQSSRTKKGQIESFDVYQERVLEWMQIAEEYHLPTFIIGVGLGGLIAVNLLEKVDLSIEGLVLLSPLFAFHASTQTRKHALTSHVGDVSKSAKFELGIDLEKLTSHPEVQEETMNDALMLKKVSYHWYKQVAQSMKKTMEHIDKMKTYPMCVMYGTEDTVSDVQMTQRFVHHCMGQELYFKSWTGLVHEIHNEPEREAVMRYVLSFLNNRIYAAGFVVEDQETLDK